MVNKSEVIIYTDGSCLGNPGPGGWASIILDNGREYSLSGGCNDTTNNRMELTAAIQAFRVLKQASEVQLFTDSEYLKRGVTEWMKTWKARSWKRKGGVLANIDLWQALDREISRHTITWHWLKGHNGSPMNEKADRLAKKAIPRS